MTLGERVEERMLAAGLSQAELARRVGVSQPSIYALIRRNKTGSRNLHAIARELATTTAYLEGETDDPSVGATPQPPKPTAQIATLQVLLPDVRALERMFLGVLKASEGLSQEALAHELALMLPKGLGLVRGPLVFEALGPIENHSDKLANDHDDHHAQQRA
jgi:transcriptional regulator with XRE-family HTH domain